MINRFIRFGEIPEGERSKIFYNNIFVGYEQGVSVWDAVCIDGDWRIILPKVCFSNTLNDIECCIRNNISTPVYVVTGDVIEGTYGTSGEPLLRNVRILRRLPPATFLYLLRDDTFLMAKDQIKTAIEEKLEGSNI